MITRRVAMLGLMTNSLLFNILPAAGQVDDKTVDSFDQLTFPPVDTLDNPEPFGYSPPTEAQKARAAEVVRTTPKGPRPIDIAQSFVDRFYKQDPEVISQWPSPSSWNPLVVEFFSATTLRANNDMIAWCAAFANWCIERSGRNGSRSAASQSFLGNAAFKTTDDPNIGDLVVFTCYDKLTGKSVGLGHVAFVKEKPANGRIKVIGGNQSADGHSSIISERYFPISPFDVRRHVGNNYILCTMRLNTFVRIV
jgi:uncharacterized protein (TIGR02594 family)